MQIKLGTLNLHIDLLMLLFPILAVLLDYGRSTALLLVSLGVREFAHWAMAKVVRVNMRSIRLTPFGGLSQIDNPYSVSPPRICAVSAAGPLSNLLVILTAAALCRWTLLAPLLTIELIQINALLLCFNLLPALPLDGGRILFAALSAVLPEKKALRFCLWTGRMLAALLIALALIGLIVVRQINLSFLIAAVFILASESDERRALAGTRTQAILDSLRPIVAPTPADLIAVDSATPPQVILRTLRPNRVTLFAIYQDGHLREITDDRTLIQQMIRLEQSPQ